MDMMIRTWNAESVLNPVSGCSRKDMRVRLRCCGRKTWLEEAERKLDENRLLLLGFKGNVECWGREGLMDRHGRVYATSRAPELSWGELKISLRCCLVGQNKEKCCRQIDNTDQWCWSLCDNTIPLVSHNVILMNNNNKKWRIKSWRITYHSKPQARIDTRIIWEETVKNYQ